MVSSHEHDGLPNVFEKRTAILNATTSNELNRAVPNLINQISTFLDKRLVNINSRLKKETNKKRFITKFSRFLVALLTGHSAVFEIKDFLEFWSTCLTVTKNYQKNTRKLFLRFQLY